MPRYKDLPKTHLYSDGYTTPAEPAITERQEEDKYTKVIEEIRWELQEIKKDIQSLKDFVETMDKNGLKMKRQW
jgi:hypothetical protein